MPVISGIGPQSGASQIIGSSSLPASPTFRQCYITPDGMYVCLADGSWSLLDSADAGTVSGSGVTNRLTKWIDGTGSVLGDSGVADDGTNILALRPFAVGYGLSTPAALLAGPRISAASTISTSPRGILSAQFSTDTAGARVGFQKARGTLGTPTTVVTGDTLGRLMFRGYDGTSYLEMGSIEIAANGTIGTSQVPTQMIFSTATNANPSVLTTALTIGNDQSTTLAGTLTLTPTARASGVASYLTINIPTDTGQTASTESIGLKTVTGTRTWATTGTVALQRENFFAGPTYASASASQTFTDVFTLYATPPVQGTNAIFTRNHTLGIVDSTSASSSITGGLVVATALGTAATSVGIGGGNINAGGTGTFGGTLSVTGHVTFEGVTSTGATGTGKLVFDTSPTFTTQIISPVIYGGNTTTSTLALRSANAAGTTGADIIFGVGTSGSTEALRIFNSGHMSMGGTTDLSPLRVQDATQQTAFTGTGNGGLSISGTTNTNDYLTINFISGSAVPMSKIANKQGSGGSELHFGLSNSFGSGITIDAMSIAASGTLTLNTTVYQSCTALTTNASAVVGCTASDITLKDIQSVFTRGLNAITKLVPQNYSFKPLWFQHDGGQMRASLVAQDVERYIPEAVSKMSGGIKQIDNSTMIATLVNAIRELKDIVDMQGRRLIALSNA